jgi:hypothetical protein
VDRWVWCGILRSGDGERGNSWDGDETVGAQIWLIWSVECAVNKGELGMEATLRAGSRTNLGSKGEWSSLLANSGDLRSCRHNKDGSVFFVLSEDVDVEWSSWP